MQWSSVLLCGKPSQLLAELAVPSYHLPISQPPWNDLFRELGAHGGEVDVELVTFLDTCDWRLWRAGSVLELAEGPEHTSCRLLDRVSAVVAATARVTGAPRFSTDLPQGVLRKRVAKLIKSRALTELVQVRRVRRSWDQSDPLGKILCRVVLEEHTLLEARASAALPGQLRVVPVRGYAGAGKRLDEALRARVSIKPANKPVLATALEHLGRAPLDTVVEMPRLSSAATIESALKDTLRAFTKSLEINAPLVVRDIDAECLHEFRVAVRRIRSLISRFKKVVPEATAFADDFRWLGTVTGPLRDLDVYLIEFPTYQARVSSHTRQHLRPLRKFLAERRQDALSEVARALVSDRFETFLSRWNAYLHERSDSSSPLSQNPVIEVAYREIRRCYKTVIRDGRRIDDSSPASELHDLRKRCKKLRYLLETFRTLAREQEVEHLIRELKKLQDVLGTFQDLEVHVDYLASVGESISGSGAGRAPTLMAMGELLASLRTEHDRTRERFAAVFARFDRPNNSRLLKELFS